MSECPATVPVRARDVRPYHFALWCTVGGGPEHANEIVGVGWTADGRVKFMLDSFNFDFHGPDDVLELIPVTEPHRVYAAKYGPASGWTIGPRPVPPKPADYHDRRRWQDEARARGVAPECGRHACSAKADPAWVNAYTPLLYCAACADMINVHSFLRSPGSMPLCSPEAP